MLTSQRKRLILEQLAREGQVLSKALSTQFAVSEDTIRRDLRELAAEGNYSASTAGRSRVGSDSHLRRAQIPAPGFEKAGGAEGAELILPGQVVIIDGGTTTAELITFLPPDLHITVVTHSPSIALALVEHPCIDVILIGGKLFKHSVVTTGTAAIEGISAIHADLFFMGVTGIHAEAGLTTGDYEEASVKRAFSRRAAETIVLASAEKINAASSYVIGELAMVNTMVVEEEADAGLIAALEKAGVVVVKAD
jgi:DeoR/GlpR family transcriptional regulator of sugar metabolism